MTFQATYQQMTLWEWQPVLPRLTHRQADVLELALDGLDPRSIAQMLAVSIKTVYWHFYEMRRKWQCGSSEQVVQKARLVGFGKHKNTYIVDAPRPAPVVRRDWTTEEIRQAIWEAMQRAKARGYDKLHPKHVVSWFDEEAVRFAEVHEATLREHMAAMAEQGMFRRIGKRGGYQLVG
jgi:DNA-binding CsgD family transcriptional regulator